MRAMICLCICAAALFAQPQTATLTGVVRLANPDEPLQHATVSIVELRRLADTDAEGRYTFSGVAPGRYHVVAHMHAMADETRAVKLEAGQQATLDFRLSLGVVHQEITVTASGREQTALDTFQAVTAVDSLELATIEEGLVEAEYRQAGARYAGGEVRAGVLLVPDLWLRLGFDAVDAQLRRGPIPLPRVPPARGRVALDFRRVAFGLRPELVLANAQNRLFPGETRTAGYALANVAASYSYARRHALHVFSFELFNATDRLYRNHLSFIKDLAPEIGRGARFTYTVRFF